MAILGYPGFVRLAAYLKSVTDHETAFNSTELICWAINRDVLDVRLIVGLPWLIAPYAVKIDWRKLISDALTERMSDTW